MLSSDVTNPSHFSDFLGALHGLDSRSIGMGAKSSRVGTLCAFPLYIHSLQCCLSAACKVMMY